MRYELIDRIKAVIGNLLVGSKLEYNSDKSPFTGNQIPDWNSVLAVVPAPVITFKIPATTASPYNYPYTANDKADARAFAKNAFGAANTLDYLPNTVCRSNFTSVGAAWGVGITSFDIYSEDPNGDGTFAVDTYIKIQ